METRADLLWAARPGTVAALRWWVREGRVPWGFYFVAALILGFGLLPYLSQFIPDDFPAHPWIVYAWSLWVAVILVPATIIFGKCKPFDLGFTGRTALPASIGATLHNLDGSPPPDAPTIRREIKFTLTAALVMGLVYLALGTIIYFLAPELVRGEIGHRVRYGADGRVLGVLPLEWVWIFAMVIAAPIGEEILFRSYVYATFRIEYGPGMGALFSAIVFAVMHAVFAWQGPVHLNHFLGGLVFAFCYERTGSIYPGMILHALGNGALLAIGFLPLQL